MLQAHLFVEVDNGRLAVGAIGAQDGEIFSCVEVGGPEGHAIGIGDDEVWDFGFGDKAECSLIDGRG